MTDPHSRPTWHTIIQPGCSPATGSATTYASEYSDTRQLDFRLGVMRRISEFTVGVNAVAVAAERGACTNSNSRCNPTLLLILQRSF